MTKLHYTPGATATEKTRQLTIVSADLSSAAIRLASIDDVLRTAGVSRGTYNACRAYFKGGGKLSDAAGKLRFDEWFHVMLRDGAAHEEPPLTPKATDTKSMRRRTRQTYIEKTTFAEAYARIQKIANDLFTELRTRHNIVPPIFR
jgi:hypothetical protein